MDYRGRIVAQVLFGEETHSFENRALCTQGYLSGFPVDIGLLEWDCQMSDDSALFLNMVTKQHPSILISLTLSISQLSRVGLHSIQDVLI